MLGEVALRIGNHCNERIPIHLYERNEYLYLCRLATFRKADYHIIVLDNAQVAVYGIRCMHKNGGCARRVERCNDFLCNECAFSDSSTDYAPVRV